jgi:cell division protein FtsA
LGKVRLTLERTVVGIDVGTTKVCTLVGQMDGGSGLRIVGVGVVPSKGLRKGVVVNVSETTEAIAASVEKAERISGYKIEHAHVGVAGAHVSSFNSRGVVAVSRGHSITEDDVSRVLDAALAIAIPHNREVIHAVPRGYIVDGQDGVRDPLGMHGFRLEVEAHIITGAATSIHNLGKCVNQVGIEVDEFVLAPLASGQAVLTNNEREMGVVLADIGGGTTDMAIFIEGSVWHTAVLAVGGNHLTNDVAVGLRAPFATAEEIKEKYGYARADGVAADETVEVAVFGEDSWQAVPRRFLAEIIEARAAEILNLMLQEVKRSGYDGLLPAGVVLCGGGSQLAGVKELGREILQLPTRIGTPRDLQGLVDVLSTPAYATGVGLLLWGLREEARRVPSERPIGLWQRIVHWLRSFLPG